MSTGPGPTPRRRGPEEKRHLTVLFSDLTGSTRLGHAADPEVLDEVLQPVKDAAFRAVEAHAGVVIQFQGDGVLAIFGYPDPQEDDVRRATEAALDLHAAVRDLESNGLVPPSLGVRMHSGIHSGLVLVREGDAVQGRYELVGDPPNVAAALCSRAGPDEILATRYALLGALPFFETETAQPFVLKGKPEPVPAYRVLGRSGARTRFEASRRRGLAPFIGREDALGSLVRGLDHARTGRSSRVRVVGDAGIGKTRTVEEFSRMARARGSIVLSGYCEGSVAPLWPFQLILRQAFGVSPDPNRSPDASVIEAQLAKLELSDEVGEILGMLSLEPSESSKSEAARGGASAIRALVKLLQSLAKEEPLVLFLDDWQWADDASRAVASALEAQLHDTALLWIFAARPSGPSDEGVGAEQRIELAPFRDIESAEAIEALSPGGLDLGIASQFHQRSGGNPLFLEELCRSLRPTEGRADVPLEIPPTLHGLIETRVHALPPAQGAALRTAAVVGNVVPAWLLERLTGLREGDPVLEELAANDLLYRGVEDGTFRFKHGITRDAVYHSILLSERRALHGRIADHLDERHWGTDSERPHEALAYHYEGAANYEQASRSAELAGDRAWASAALDRTRSQYAAALASLDQLPSTPANRRRWLEISKRRAFACVFNPAPEQLSMLTRAAEIGHALDDLDAVGHAHFWHGFISFSLGNLRESIEQYKLGLAVAEQSGNAKLVAQLRANLGESYAAACEYDEAIVLLDESIESKRRLQSRDRPVSTPTGSAFALACKASAASERGDANEADLLFEESLASVRGSGHPVEGSCLGLQAQALLLRGHFEACIEVAERACVVAQRVNGPYVFGRGRTEAAFSRFMLTGDEAELETLRETVEWLEDKGMRLFISTNYGCLAEAMLQAAPSGANWRSRSRHSWIPDSASASAIDQYLDFPARPGGGRRTGEREDDDHRQRVYDRCNPGIDRDAGVRGQADRAPPTSGRSGQAARGCPPQQEEPDLRRVQGRGHQARGEGRLGPVLRRRIGVTAKAQVLLCAVSG